MGREDALSKMVLELCAAVRRAVRPRLGSEHSKGIEGTGATGDVTFSVDEVAESAVSGFLEETGDIAYYTEDRGLTVLGDPEYVLVIDPIDGTRPAAVGLESCCVSIAAAPYSPRTEALTLGDVRVGAVVELKNDAVFIAERGAGARITIDGEQVRPAPSGATDLGRIFWTAGFRGRPAEPLVTVIGDLIDISSVGGGTFDLGSATFSITRVALGSMDVYVDVGQRMVEQSDAVREMFLGVGGGAILNNYPYDLAAAALIASECGATVTDAYGGPLDRYPLVPEQGGGQLSSLVSGNGELHRLVLEELERGMARLGERYGGR